MSILKNSKKHTKKTFRSPFSFRNYEEEKEINYDDNKNESIKDSFEKNRSKPLMKTTRKKSRGRKPKIIKKDSRITFCCTPREAVAIRKFAHQQNISVSELIMRCMYQYIEKT